MINRYRHRFGVCHVFLAKNAANEVWLIQSGAFQFELVERGKDFHYPDNMKPKVKVAVPSVEVEFVR